VPARRILQRERYNYYFADLRVGNISFLFSQGVTQISSIKALWLCSGWESCVFLAPFVSRDRAVSSCDALPL